MFDYLKTVVIAVAVALPVSAAVYAKTNHKHKPNNPYEAAVIVEVGDGHGSGVHLGNGLILTAAHVVEDEPGIVVRDARGVATDGAVVGFDQEHDLALVQTNYTGPTAWLSCKAMHVGDRLHIVGNPFDLEFIHTFGQVAGETRRIAQWAEGFIGDIVTGPGNSGGPVFNTRGEIVGVLVGGFQIGREPLPGWSFIVPSTTVCRLMGRS